MDKKVIMIVDDEEGFVQEFSEMLHLCGYQTKSFLDAEEAYKKVHSVKPNLVLLDLNMEGLDGYKFARDLKDNPETELIPVIVISGHLTEGKKNRLKNESGVSRCLQKPVQPLSIISEIEAIFAGER